jgi:multidrug transporter EmrE-like cation transporter
LWLIHTYFAVEFQLAKERVALQARRQMSKEIGSGGWPPPPSALDIDLAVDLRCIENASRPLYEKSWLPCVGTSTFSSEAYEGSGCCATNHTSVYKSGWMPGTCEFDCEAREHIFSCKGEYKFGLGWGLVLSLFADCVISVGLALQKVAHNRLATAARITASQKGAEPEEVRGNAYLKMRVWWAGMLLTISGEVCNFASYGDRDTPASVVASVGCVGVICNWFIATFFLHEEFRKRDVIGVASIITGVILIIVFVPKDPTGAPVDAQPAVSAAC